MADIEGRADHGEVPRAALPLRALVGWIALAIVAGVVALPSAVHGGDAELSTGAGPGAAAGAEISTAASRPALVSTTTTTATASTSTTVAGPRRRAPGTVTTMPDVGEVEGGTPLPPGTPLSGPVALSGTVRDTRGPVAGACVEVFNGGFAPWYLDSRHVTGADGRFAVDLHLALQSDDLTIRVKDCTGADPGFGQVVTGVRAFPQQSYDLDVLVAPGAAISGTVVDDDFHSVDGTGLCVRVDGGVGAVDAPVAANGTFRVTGVPAAPIVGLTVLDGCDEINPIPGSSFVQIGAVQPGDDKGFMVTIPHGPRSRA